MVEETLDGQLAEWLALRDLDRVVLMERFGIAADDVEEDARYGALVDLRVLAPHALPGLIFCAGDDVALIYLNRLEASAEAMGAAVARLPDASAPEYLRSPAGKGSLVTLYAAAGVAYSADSSTNRVDFLELFAPTTATEYRRRLYVEPEVFVL